MFEINKNPSVSDLRKFGAAMLVGFAVIGALLWLTPWMKSGDVSTLGWSGTGFQLTASVLGFLGVGLCLLGFAVPSVAKPVYVVWMTATVPIGIVMSIVLLTVLFVLLLPIFSLVVRLGDPLRKKLSKEGSYWEDYKPHAATIERMKRPF